MTQDELVSSVVELVERAKREEREACARLVEGLVPDDSTLRVVFVGIAEKIRERK